MVMVRVSRGADLAVEMPKLAFLTFCCPAYSMILFSRGFYGGFGKSCFQL
jgi:hypothetical protein